LGRKPLNTRVTVGIEVGTRALNSMPARDRRLSIWMMQKVKEVSKLLRQEETSRGQRFALVLKEGSVQ
jgi:hypothetical protein